MRLVPQLHGPRIHLLMNADIGEAPVGGELLGSYSMTSLFVAIADALGLTQLNLISRRLKADVPTMDTDSA